MDKLDNKYYLPSTHIIYNDVFNHYTRKIIEQLNLPKNTTLELLQVRGDYNRRAHLHQQWFGSYNCGMFHITINNKELLYEFNLSEMPGCCGIVISTTCKIHSDYQNKGLNKVLTDLKESMAYRAGFTVMLVTEITHENHRADTSRNVIGLKKNFSLLKTFKNKRSYGREVGIFYRELRDTINPPIIEKAKAVLTFN